MIKKYQCMLTEIIVFALYAVSYNLLLGYAGLLSLADAHVLRHGRLPDPFPRPLHVERRFVALAMTTAVGFITGGFLLRHKGPISN